MATVKTKSIEPKTNIINLQQLKQMIPTNKTPEDWLNLINKYFAEYYITTPKRIAGFMAQAGHESSDFKDLIENMNYSWTALRKTFPRYFPTDALAKEYERKPELIANRVYDDALRINKIGNTRPGDGWKFIGRGIFQLSGRWNYEKFARAINMPTDEAAVYLTTKEGAIHAACWFWRNKGCQVLADKGDIKGMSKAVNGGDIGLADRTKRYNRNLEVLRYQ